MPYDKLTGYVPPKEQKGDTEEDSVPNITHGTRLWSLLSIIIASFGILLITVPAIGIFFGAAGIGFSVFSRKKNGYFYTMAVAGIIVGAVAVASCAFFIVFNEMNEAGLVINIFDLLIKR